MQGAMTSVPQEARSAHPAGSSPATARHDRNSKDTAFVQHTGHDSSEARGEIIAGLTAPRAYLSPNFFYDVLGSRLFEAITALPEYYPTRVEAEILARCQHEIAARVGTGPVLIDLGAGNCTKAARLFPVLHPAQYVAVDISADFLRDTLTCLQQQFPGIPMVGVGADLSAPFDFPRSVGRRNRLLFYPGSSIGNFTPIEALAMLQRMRAVTTRGDSVLIGVDLLKSIDTLEDAYDDPLGVTAAFNLNVLRHVNRIAGADFDVRDWQHIALFNPAHNRVEMHLRRGTT